jgi:hypothetical protein
MAAQAPVTKTVGGNAAFHNFHNDFAHVQDPNERRRLALAEIDKAPFGWYHVRACVVAGIGFFTDSYDVSESLIVIWRSCLTSLLDFRYQPCYRHVGCCFLERRSYPPKFGYCH